MSMSLREQLIAAGLGSKKQGKKVEQEQRQQARRERKQNTPPPIDKQRLAAQQAQAAKIARDMELNRKQREKAERRALTAEIRQLVEKHRIPRMDSEEYFNFIDRKKVKRIAVTPEVRAKIINGELMIVRHDGFYALVPAEIAARIKERDPEFIVPLDLKPSDAPAEDDPYKDHVVPDDLMW
jgi:uncharacterized protein YaiL (DUF2058 family)